MAELLEVVGKLTEEERRTVREFAEFLLARRGGPPAARVEPGTDRKVSFDGWAGCLAHVHPELSDAEFKRLIRDEWARAAED